MGNAKANKTKGHLREGCEISQFPWCEVRSQIERLWKRAFLLFDRGVGTGANINFE
jgi:hypothetical protein